MTRPWDMARVRSRQLPRAYKPVGSVDPCGPQDINSPSMMLMSGERVPYKQYMRLRTQDIVCPGCGYHVCSCSMHVDDSAWQKQQERTFRSKVDLAEALMAVCPQSRAEAIALLTTGKLP